MQLLSAKARITGQESMLGTSAIRGILWLVPRSEDACLAVNGVDIYQLVSQSLLQEYKTRKKGRKTGLFNQRNILYRSEAFWLYGCVSSLGESKMRKFILSRCRRLNEKSENRSSAMIIRTLRSNDATATRTSLIKVNLRSFSLYGDYSYPLTLSIGGEPS